MLGEGSFPDTLEKENGLRSSLGAGFKNEGKLSFGILFPFLSIPPSPTHWSPHYKPGDTCPVGHECVVMTVDRQAWKACLSSQRWAIWPSWFCVAENLHADP